MGDRMKLLGALETRFINEQRGSAAEEHAKVLGKTQELLTSEQMKAFQGSQRAEGHAREVRRQQLRPRLLDGAAAGGSRRAVCRGELRRLGFASATASRRSRTKLPELDKAFAALMEDLKQRGLLDSTVVLCMGEFGRTPRINGNAGRDHFARAWSVVLGGGGIQGGRAIGKTSADGTSVESEPHSSEDLMAIGLPGAGHLAGNHVHGAERPADENRRRRPSDSRVVCVR